MPETSFLHNCPADNLTFTVYVQEKYTYKEKQSLPKTLQHNAGTGGYTRNEHRSVRWELWAEEAASFWSKLIIGSEEQVAGGTTADTLTVRCVNVQHSRTGKHQAL